MYRDCIAIDVIRACGLFLCLFLPRLSCLRSSFSLDDRFELLLGIFDGLEHIWQPITRLLHIMSCFTISMVDHSLNLVGTSSQIIRLASDCLAVSLS